MFIINARDWRRGSFRKGYIIGWSQDRPKDLASFCFDSHLDKAGVWDKEEAESWCSYFNYHSPVRIPSATGGPYIIRNFKVEQKGPNEFVIFAEAPFVREPAKN